MNDQMIKHLESVISDPDKTSRNPVIHRKPCANLCENTKPSDRGLASRTAEGLSCLFFRSPARVICQLRLKFPHSSGRKSCHPGMVLVYSSSRIG